MKRPEWVTCIRKGESKEGLCGRWLGFEFAFVDKEHAVANEARGGRLLLCEECRAVVLPSERKA
jgi:hypothetical protein